MFFYTALNKQVYIFHHEEEYYSPEWFLTFL